jgi:hypothetical protein
VTWFELLCRALGRDDLFPASDARFRDDLVPAGDARLPFAVSSTTAIEWQEPRVVQRGDRAWEVVAGSNRGLEATWRVREHPDTRAVECSGSVRNAGRAAFEGIRELRTLDLRLGLAEAWGEPFARTVNGARYVTGSFPPDDFRVRDCQLLRMWGGDFGPLYVSALPDGRSSGQSLPCLVLSGEHGDRGLAMFYEWSGLWHFEVEQSPSPASLDWPWGLRITAGVWGLALELRPGEELPLPNLLITGFEGDLDAGGNALRRHVARHVSPLLNGEPALPPVSFNHWFSYEDDFTTAKLGPTAEACADAGVEYFCVDAGWFPGGFRRGIGNWSGPDPTKFPDGVSAFSDWLAQLGMRYGTWFELEFAHVESELYRAHPEWFLPGPRISPWLRVGRDFSYDDDIRADHESNSGERYALLDLGQAEARHWCIDRIVEAYERWGVRWIRWDFNQQPRPHWDLSAAEGRIGINQVRHVQGFYEIFDEIQRACPDLFIEQCASGGHRIDLGTVRRGHAFWMNDHTIHTDVIRAFQHGLNTVLPGIYADTNLCQERFDFDDYDYLSHGGGSFGLSGRLEEASPADFERFRAAVERFKGYRHLLGGDYLRSTGNPEIRFEHAHVAWSDGSEVVEMDFNGGGRRRAATLTRHGA